MPDTPTSLLAKLDAIAENCAPQPFLRLATTAKDFIFVASSLTCLQDEAEFDLAFSRFVHTMFRFYGAFQQAYDMGLLSGTDDTTRASPRDLRELDKALGSHHHRIACIVAVCRLAEATACLIGVRRFPNYHFPWTQLFELLLEDPVYAALFQDADLTKWRAISGDLEKCFVNLAQSSGFRRIGIKHCCQMLIYDAGELWTDSLTHGMEEDKLKECAGRIKRLLNFLTMPAQERWILQELRSIGSTDSMQAVLKEVLRHDLRRVRDSDKLDLDKIGQFCGPASDLPANTLVLTNGWLSKKKYLVTLPDLSYFVDRLSSVAFEKATSNPIEFLHVHWRGASRSVKAEHCRHQLLRIENAAADLQFRKTIEHVMANLAGETFAYAISSSVGTSPEASIFIAGCFGIAVDVVMTLRRH